MTADRRPAKRLLVAPALILAAILATVIITGSARGSTDDTLEVAGLLPAVTSELPVCRRDRDGTPPTGTALRLDGGRITSGQVIACPAAFDGQRVTYAGEVVGDMLHRDGGAWVLVNDDDYALRVGPLPSHRNHRGTNAGLTVWLPSDLVDDISGLGRPNQRGDVIQVVGLIMRTDPADGGGLTLRAQDIDILQPARQITEPLHGPQAVLAGGSLLAAAVLAGLRRQRTGSLPRPRR